jgi:hypothetical protein
MECRRAGRAGYGPRARRLRVSNRHPGTALPTDKDPERVGARVTALVVTRAISRREEGRTAAPPPRRTASVPAATSGSLATLRASHRPQAVSPPITTTCGAGRCTPRFGGGGGLQRMGPIPHTKDVLQEFRTIHVQIYSQCDMGPIESAARGILLIKAPTLGAECRAM